MCCNVRDKGNPARLPWKNAGRTGGALVAQRGGGKVVLRPEGHGDRIVAFYKTRVASSTDDSNATLFLLYFSKFGTFLKKLLGSSPFLVK